MAASWYQWQDSDLLVRVWAQPRARRDEIAGLHGDCLKVRVTAPPEDGRANQAIIQVLAAVFALAPSRVALVSGGSGRAKTFRISGPGLRDPQVVLAAIP